MKLFKQIYKHLMRINISVTSYHLFLVFQMYLKGTYSENVPFPYVWTFIWIYLVASNTKEILISEQLQLF